MTKTTLILIFTILFFTSCNEVVEYEQSLSDEELYPNYVKAIKNESTFQNFLVVKVKNLNNGEIREYCTKGNFLKGALHRELNLGYSKDGIIKVYETAIENKERYFEFKNDSAIWNISAFDKYSMKELSEFENQIGIDSLIYRIENGKDWGITISNDKEMKMVAHSLFNKGILTAENSCFGGMLKLDKSE
ncbi:hypothetical protein [Polaribacter sp. M15]